MMVSFQMYDLQFWMWKPWSDKKSLSRPISRNVNFELKFLEDSRRYLILISVNAFSIHTN